MNFLNACRQLNLCSWQRRGSRFWEQEICLDFWQSQPSPSIAYRLKKWPQLHASMKRVGSYRVLSLLSHEPICIERLSKCMQGNLTQAVEFLKLLEQQDALEILNLEWKTSEQTLQQSLGAVWSH